MDFFFEIVAPSVLLALAIPVVVIAGWLAFYEFKALATKMNFTPYTKMNFTPYTKRTNHK